jgi:hypothetical protein
MSKRNPTYTSQMFAGVVVIEPGTNTRRVAMNAPMLYQHFLNQVCKVGDLVSMYITNKRPKRSLAQNNYYHLYLSLISLASGHTVEELHAWVKGKFLSIGIQEVFGQKTRLTRSTTELNIGEFLELLDDIEFETGVPLPNTEPFSKLLTHKEFNDLKEKQKKIYQRLTAKIKI